MRDMSQQTSPANLIAAATYDAATTPGAVDLATYQSASIYLQVGVGGITFTNTNKIEFVLTHSDDGETYENVTAADLVGDALLPTTITGGIVRALKAAHAAGTIQEIGYVGNRRYLKLFADFGGTHASGTPIGAFVVRGQPLSAPV